MSLSVNYPEEGYIAHQAKWKLCRDVISGKDDIFDSGEIYLPKLSEQTPDEYAAYQLRAGWYGATDRTKIALKGMIFRKDPVTTYKNPKVEEFLKDVTMDGVSAIGFASMAIDEVLETGRGGILVDYHLQDSGDRPGTAADAEAKKLRSYVQLYSAEQIIGVVSKRVNNQTIITQIRLREVEENISSEDEFKKTTRRIVRVLEINSDGVYQQRIFSEEAKSESDDSSGDYGRFTEDKNIIIPKKNGETFSYIPFFFLGVQDMDMGYDKPPLLDLCEVNLDYFRTKSDYKHGLHFTGLPTVIITGHGNAEGTTYRIGSTVAWVFEEEGADAKYLEFQGQGLSESREELQNLKNDMASLGARMLTAEKKQVEAAESHRIKRSGEQSLLASMANSSSEALSRALNEALSWNGIEDELSLRLNTDFNIAEMSAKDVLDLWRVVQSGGMLIEDFFYNLHQGERLSPDIEDQDRMTRIQTSPPPAE